jgi:hypothetical protein
MKKPVHSSHLALRFYKRDGWALDCLKGYLTKGEFKDTSLTRGDADENAYFILDVGSSANMKSLLENEVSKVVRWYTDERTESDLEYMNSFNW